MKIVYSDLFLGHDTKEHPETKERLISIINYLEKQGFSKNEFLKPTKIEDDDLLIVHAPEYLELLKKYCKEERSIQDNVFNEDTFDVAIEACGASLKAAMHSNEFSFALIRPPGHHAGRNFFEGFCYLNNIAFAVRKLIFNSLAERCLIIDFDVHHGQGTQDIFSYDNSVFYLSFHQDPLTIYPFMHFSTNAKNIKNIPIQPATDDNTYLKIFKKHIIETLDLFDPDVIAISAGFDIYYGDTIVGNRLNIKDSETFFRIGKIINENSSARKFAVLEGGYFLPKLGENVFNFIKAFY